ncbi:excalibur calcium-binding domain-containing protein [Streptomyces rubiginosohelvolus]
MEACTSSDPARDAGAAPLVRGGPGYRDQLDRGGNGVACEPAPKLCLVGP